MLISAVSIGQEYHFISYNIRYDNEGDGDNRWEVRKKSVVNLLRLYQPNVFGLQEALSQQVDYINESLSDYDFIGVGRDDGKRKGEFSPIFYNSTLFTVLESGTFWLSETPDQISVGWDSAMERICTYAKFRDLRNGNEFWFFNTHFDHRGQKARQESAKLILHKIKELANKSPLILTGDFNLEPETQAIQSIQKDLIDPLNHRSIRLEGPKGTFSGFVLKAKLQGRIDYIFIQNLTPLSYVHLNDKRKNGLWVSDHLPVFLKARLN